MPKLIDPFGEMTFDCGETLTVLRGRELDEFGDPTGKERTHTIGKCAIRRQESRISRDGESLSDRATITVTAPPGSDIKETDRVRLPDGTTAVVTTAPIRPRNPFTGWQPFVKFTLEAE